MPTESCWLRGLESFLEPESFFVQSLGRVRPLTTPWTADRQAPLVQGFPRQESWDSCDPFSGDPPSPGIKPASPALTGGFFYHCATREAPEDFYQTPNF